MIQQRRTERSKQARATTPYRVPVRVGGLMGKAQQGAIV